MYCAPGFVIYVCVLLVSFQLFDTVVQQDVLLACKEYASNKDCWHLHSPNSTWLVTSRHDTLSSPCILAQGKVVMRRIRRDTLVTKGATRTTLVRGRRDSVDWGGHVHLFFFSPEVVPEIDANPECKRLNFYVRALLLLCRLLRWNKNSGQAGHDALDTRVRTCVTRKAHHTCRVET